MSVCVRCTREEKKVYCKKMCKPCYHREWKKTEKGIAAEKRYTNSKKGRESSLKKTLKYQASEHGKKTLDNYHKSDRYLS